MAEIHPYYVLPPTPSQRVERVKDFSWIYIAVMVAALHTLLPWLSTFSHTKNDKPVRRQVQVQTVHLNPSPHIVAELEAVFPSPAPEIPKEELPLPQPQSAPEEPPPPAPVEEPKPLPPAPIEEPKEEPKPVPPPPTQDPEPALQPPVEEPKPEPIVEAPPPPPEPVKKEEPPASPPLKVEKKVEPAPKPVKKPDAPKKPPEQPKKAADKPKQVSEKPKSPPKPAIDKEKMAQEAEKKKQQEVKAAQEAEKKRVEAEKKRQQELAAEAERKRAAEVERKRLQEESAKRLALLNKAQENLAKNKETRDKISAAPTTNLHATAIPTAIEGLQIDGVVFEQIGTAKWTAREISYQDEVSQILKMGLRLPEHGAVKLELTINKNGKVEKVKILSSENAKNKQYIEQKVPGLHFPSFGNRFPDQTECTFSITLNNEHR